MSASEPPEGWSITSIGECFFDIRNGTTAVQNKNAVGVPVSRIETIQDASFDQSRVRWIENPSPEMLGRFRYAPGDIAFSHINSYEHVGKTALYNGSPKPFIHGMNLLRMRFGHKHVHPPFAHLFMQTGLFREEVRSRVLHAVNQVSINQSNLREVLFLISPLAEQNRIVAMVEKLLDRVTAARDRLAKVPAILKRFRQSVLAAACSGRLTADWRDAHPDTESVPQLLDRIRAERARRTPQRTAQQKPCAATPLADEGDALAVVELPETWQWCRCEEFCQPERAITYGVIKLGPPANGGVPTLRSSDVRHLYVDDASVKSISPAIADQYGRTFLAGGEILVTVRGTLGGVAVVPERMRGYNISREVAMVPIESALSSAFFMYTIGSMRAQNWLTGVVRGVAYSGINIRDLKRLPLPVPPVEEQHEIVRRVEALFKLADAIDGRVAAASQRADKLTQSILAKAFRGKLVPTEAELARQEGRDYEPASVLLERIRAEREAAGNEPKTPRRRKQKTAREQQPAGDDDTSDRSSVPTPTVAVQGNLFDVGTPRAKRKRESRSVEDYTANEIMAVFRQACRNRREQTRDDLLKAVSVRLGSKRLGSKIEDILRGHLRAAIRRKIVGANGQNVWPETHSMQDYERDELVDAIRSVTRKGCTYGRDELIDAVVEYLGFARVTDRIRQSIKSAINGAIRRGELRRIRKDVERTG